MTSEHAVDPTTSLEELHRATLLTHTRYPRLGAWYPPLAGTIVGTWVGLFAAARPWRDIGQFALVGVIIIGAVLYTRRRGVLPDMRKAPGEIRSEVRHFLVGVVAYAIGVALLWQIAPWWAVAGVAGAVAAAGIALYEHRYAQAARAAEISSGVIEDSIAG